MTELSAAPPGRLIQRRAQLETMIEAARRRNLSLAADMLSHYLNGNGQKRLISTQLLRLDGNFELARVKLLDRVSVAVLRRVVELVDDGAASGRLADIKGEPLTAVWAGDLFNASGSSNIEAKPDIDISIRSGDISVEGWADLRWYDRYWWNTTERKKSWVSGLASFRSIGIWLSTTDLDELRMFGLAKDFDMESTWDERIATTSEFDKAARVIMGMNGAKRRYLRDELEAAEYRNDPDPHFAYRAFASKISEMFAWVDN